MNVLVERLDEAFAVPNRLTSLLETTETINGTACNKAETGGSYTQIIKQPTPRGGPCPLSISPER